MHSSIKKVVDAPKKVKNHIVRHRAKYTFIATSGTLVYFGYRNGQQLNAFLEEHNLREEYYQLED